MLQSTLFSGDAILQAVADDQTRISRRKNRKGDHVRKVQEALLSWDPGCLPKFGADGKFKAETAGAIRRFEIEELGIAAEQALDEVTYRSIARLDEIQAATEQPTPPPPPQLFVRRDIWSLMPDATWHPTVLAYANAVRVMQSRPATDPTSWVFQGAVHGSYNATPPGAQWNVCQHASWFFLPWHRMYLHCFEQIVREIVLSQGGPADFALPYWNYDQPSPRNRMPVPFLLATLPDGSPNPLRIEPPGRHPDWDIGRIVGPNQASSSAAMAHTTFSGPPSPGFGGPRSAPTQFNGAFGALESTPHNPVHPQVGGPMSGQCDLGQMTDPRCAALDPIFWLHHANVDRLWNRWIALGGGRANPSDAAWLDQGFQFNLPPGAAMTMTPAEVVDSANQLQYVYDDLPAPVTPVMSPTPTPPQPPQLGGASDVPVELSGRTASVQVSVPQDLVGMVNDAAGGNGSMILNVEDIEGQVDPGMVYEVYLEVQSPAGGEPRREFVGNVTFFGLPNQTSTDGDHTEPPGLRHTFDITGTVNALASAGDWDPANLRVVFEPVTSSLPEGVDSLVVADDVVVPPVSVGRVSIFIE